MIGDPEVQLGERGGGLKLDGGTKEALGRARIYATLGRAMGRTGGIRLGRHPASITDQRRIVVDRVISRVRLLRGYTWSD